MFGVRSALWRIWTVIIGLAVTVAAIATGVTLLAAA
jgi:hypothetical protein